MLFIRSEMRADRGGGMGRGELVREGLMGEEVVDMMLTERMVMGSGGGSRSLCTDLMEARSSQ
jgi:hypothetical protein